MKQIFFLLFSIQLLFSIDFNSEDGAPIRQGVHIEWYRTLASGNEGEAIFVWSDTRYGMRNIFAHKINQSGDLLWGEQGAVVTNLPGRQEDPVSITDGDGGAFIAWVDYRFDAQGDIYIQHIDSNGNIQLDPNGVALANVLGKQISINMCTDSLGGVFVTWQDKRSGIDDDIYGTHVSSDYTIGSPGSGFPIVVEGGSQNAKTIEYAGNNEAFIAWADFREGANADVYGQRFGTDMSMQFENNGIQIAASNEQELKPRATYVNNSRSFICWKVGDENSKVFYQFVDTEGLVFEDAKPVSMNEAIQTSPRVKRSNTGEVFVNWKDLRDDPIGGDQYFQKIDNNGEREWGDGVRVDPLDIADFSARFSPDSDGGVSIVWERGAFPEIDIMYQNITSSGVPTNESPIAISEQGGYQYAPAIIGDISSGLFIIYGDQGEGSIDLKVQKINSSFQPEWSDNGKTVMEGLDGDINYSKPFRVDNYDYSVIWEDNRASKKIYGTRILNAQVSSDNGKQLTFGDNSSSETDFSTPYYVKTQNYFYTATFDGLSSPKFLRINKLDQDFINVWESNGVALSAVFDMRSVKLKEVGEGVGCFWSESRGFNYDIYYQRLNSDGSIALTEQGIQLVDSNGDDYILEIIPTSDGKFLIFWLEDAWPAASLKFTKIDANGNIEIGWNPNGNQLSSTQYDSRNLQVKVISEEIGMMAVWTQNGNFSDIYAQVIDWSGNTTFSDGGVPISEADNDQGSISFDINQSRTHSLITWEDYRNGSDFEIFANIFDLQNGTIMGDEIQFSNDTTDQFKPIVKNIEDNEFFVVWEDGRGYYNEDPLLINGVDLYGSGYKMGYGMTTELNGVPVCIAYHKQQDVNITNHQGSEYFLDWIDYRSSGKEDLANYYGRIITKSEYLSNKISCVDCDVPDSFSLSSAYPNPFNGSISFDYYVPSKESIEFTIYDLTGKEIINKLILPGSEGNHRISWDGRKSDGSSVSSGMYFYSFKSNNIISKGKVTYLK